MAGRRDTSGKTSSQARRLVRDLVEIDIELGIWIDLSQEAESTPKQIVQLIVELQNLTFRFDQVCQQQSLWVYNRIKDTSQNPWLLAGLLRQRLSRIVIELQTLAMAKEQQMVDFIIEPHQELPLESQPVTLRVAIGQIDRIDQDVDMQSFDSLQNAIDKLVDWQDRIHYMADRGNLGHLERDHLLARVKTMIDQLQEVADSLDIEPGY